MIAYCLPPDGTTLTVGLDTLTAVFHRPSGITHLLADPAPQILRSLDEAPAGLDTVLDRLRARYRIEDADHEALAARLDELVSAGLVLAR